MPAYIIHKDGVYNIFSTIVDAPYFEHGLTLEQLTEFHEREYGNSELESRLKRVHERGTSSRIDDSLEDTVSCNKAGPNETEMTVEDFIAKFLTLPETKE